MSDAVGILVSLAVSVVANFITFFALERLDRGISPAITKSDESLMIQHVHFRETITTDQREAIVDHEKTIVISSTTFIVEPRRRSVLHLVMALAVGAICMTILLIALML